MLDRFSTRARLITAIAATGLLATGCGAQDTETTTPAAATSAADDEAAPAGGHSHGAGVETSEPMTVELDVTPDAKAGANLHVTASGFRWAPEHASGEHVDGEGHAHVYVDGEKLGRLYGSWMHLALEPGEHEVRVTLNANDHRDYLVDGEQVEARGNVTVDAPAAGAAAGPSPEAMREEICALAETASGDPQGTATRFSAETHGPLHDVADAVMDRDRPRAGRILVAKNEVEQLIADDPTSGEELASALATLAQQLSEDGEACAR